MDRETRHELDRLFLELSEALDEVRYAAFDPDRELAGWKRVQICGWELSQVLPGLEHPAA